MQKLKVNLGINTYEIKIEAGLLAKVGQELRGLSKANKVAIITDTNVDKLYGETLQKSLEKAGFGVGRIVVAAGEKSKSLEVLGSVYGQMAGLGLTRSDLVVTLGGGVVGDLGGLAAATFLRGIDFVQVPTSLLAQIDSSVGGKVAIDLPAGKNLVGSFYQPKAVFIDPDLLFSLPKRYLHDGLAEAIKYGCICDKTMFLRLERICDDIELMEYIDEIIANCCRIKAGIVERDEHDTGERMLLNFGHTLGHAVEKCYDYGTYTHGEGVGLGMYLLTKQTEALGLTEKGTTQRIYQILQRYNLPVAVALDKTEVMKLVAKDKKNNGKKITIVVLDKIGAGRLLELDYDELDEYIVV